MNATDPARHKTIAHKVEFEGRGVHTGEPVTLSILPAETGAGIQFRRIDLPGQPVVRASLDNVVQNELLRRTTIACGNATICTIEHVLSALAGLEISNALIEINASEPPFLDGSALPFAKAIQEAGMVEQEAPLDVLAIDRPLWFQCNNAEFVALPSSDLRITFFFSSTNPLLQTQCGSFEITPDLFLRDIAPARTFCFFDEIEPLRKAGLIRGGNLQNAIVFGRKAILNPSLRFEDEPVRHKILDFIGDLALLERFIKGHFMVWRAGHLVNAAFARFLQQEFQN